MTDAKHQSDQSDQSHQSDQPIQPHHQPHTRLITAALPYCNAEPHLGNLIGSTLSADVFARYSRARKQPTLFVCGTDRYGTATEIKALHEQMTPSEICDKYHKLHVAIYDFFGISFDYFGHTDTPLHTQLTHEIIDGLDHNHCLVTKPTQICFCVTCQRSLADRFVVGQCPNCQDTQARGDQCDACGQLTHSTTLINPRCTMCGVSNLEFRVVKHQFLKFDQTQSKVKKWFTPQHTEHHAYALTASKLEELLPAKDITRDMTWGVKVPDRFDLPNQVYYVWMEAPLGYISITAHAVPYWKELWTDPTTQLYHFIGKDNILFHTIYFPATLLGAKQGWILPHYISATHYLLWEGSKFSKSRKTGVLGSAVMSSRIEADVWRLALLRMRPETGDSNFSYQFLLDTREWVRRNIANLVARVIQFVITNYNGVIPSGQLDPTEETVLAELEDTYHKAMEHVHLRSGVECAMKLVNELNSYLNRTKFWKLEVGSVDLNNVMVTAVYGLIKLSQLWGPIAPTLVSKLRHHLGVTTDPTFDGIEIATMSTQPLPPFKHLIDKLTQY